ncbi:MAG: hypothetical protein R3F24_03655 [Gammaproteobacteria bacterium]
MIPSPPALDTGRLAGLLFELCSQLHAERLHRLALEAALMNAGLLTHDMLDGMAADSELRERGRQAAEESVARLMRVLTEGTDQRTPLRATRAAGQQGD